LPPNFAQTHRDHKTKTEKMKILVIVPLSCLVVVVAGSGTVRAASSNQAARALPGGFEVPDHILDGLLCVEDAPSLRAALARGGAFTLCPRSYISLGSQIEISGVTADVHCPTKDCTIDGRGSTRLFLGAPTKLTVDGVLFLDGKAPRSYGGAFLLANSSST
jgi:hypothetical protein